MARRITPSAIMAQPPVRITERLQQLAIDLHLTGLQKRFAEALAADANASKADAYIAVTSEEDRVVASQRGSRLAANKKVQRYYREIMESGAPAAYRSNMRIMKAWEIRARLSEMARADPTDFARLLPSGGFEFDLRACIAAGKGFLIKELSHDAETGAAKIVLHDAKDALKTLAKIEGLMQDGAPAPPAAVTHRTLVLNILSQPDARRLLDDLGQRVLDAELAEPALLGDTQAEDGVESEPSDDSG